jgi:hypothetical protein
VSVTTECDLCTWHVPDHLDGLPVTEMNERFGIAGGPTQWPPARWTSVRFNFKIV